MKTVAAIRQANLQRLAVELGSLDAVAALADTNPVYLSQLRNASRDSRTGRPREMGPALARRIEVAAGKPEGWMDHQHLDAGEPKAAYTVAQGLSHTPAHTASHVDWGAVMHTALPDKFRVTAPDDSMAPRVRSGQQVELDSTLQVRPGDGVLVIDEAGHWYLRVYRQRRPDSWEAHPLNDAYQALDSARDGLRVAAVIVAVHARWS